MIVSNGILSSTGENNPAFGVRPVITIAKSAIKVETVVNDIEPVDDTGNDDSTESTDDTGTDSSPEVTDDTETQSID